MIEQLFEPRAVAENMPVAIRLMNSTPPAGNPLHNCVGVMEILCEGRMLADIWINGMPLNNDFGGMDIQTALYIGNLIFQCESFPNALPTLFVHTSDERIILTQMVKTTKGEMMDVRQSQLEKMGIMELRALASHHGLRPGGKYPAKALKEEIIQAILIHEASKTDGGGFEIDAGKGGEITPPQSIPPTEVPPHEGSIPDILDEFMDMMDKAAAGGGDGEKEPTEPELPEPTEVMEKCGRKTPRQRRRKAQPQPTEQPVEQPSESADASGGGDGESDQEKQEDNPLLAELRKFIIKTVDKKADEMSQDVGEIMEKIQKTMDESAAKAEEVKKKAEEEQKTIVIEQKDLPDIKLSGYKHKMFEPVLRALLADLPVLLVGPSGCGKSYLCKQVAEALSQIISNNEKAEVILKYDHKSFSAGVSEAFITGRVIPNLSDGSLIYIPTPFVKLYGNGGVFLFDEIDAADANVMLHLNSALDLDGRLNLPHGETVERHKQFYCLAAANTYGNGADRQYVGRNQLDQATMDRFRASTITLDYDEDLEQNIARQYSSTVAGAPSFCDWLHGVRNRINQNGLRRIASTRYLTAGIKLLTAGESLLTVQSRLFEGWTNDERSQVGWK